MKVISFKISAFQLNNIRQGYYSYANEQLIKKEITANFARL
jgi:hypothetical protein